MGLYSTWGEGGGGLAYIRPTFYVSNIFIVPVNYTVNEKKYKPNILNKYCNVIIVTCLSCWNPRRCCNKYLSTNNNPMGLYTEGLIFGGGAYIRNGLSVSEYGGHNTGGLYSEVYGMPFLFQFLSLYRNH
jgi:hypothetical protein